jgi:hypothetical protein
MFWKLDVFPSSAEELQDIYSVELEWTQQSRFFPVCHLRSKTSSFQNFFSPLDVEESPET